MRKVNDTFSSFNAHLGEVLARHAGPEPEYTPPKVWPYQVPPEKRIKEVTA